MLVSEWFIICRCDLVRPCVPPLVRLPLRSPKIKYWFYDDCWRYTSMWKRLNAMWVYHHFGHDSITLSHFRLIVTDGLWTVLASLLNLLDLQGCFVLAFKNIFHPSIQKQTIENIWKCPGTRSLMCVVAHFSLLETCWNYFCFPVVIRVCVQMTYLSFMGFI